MRRASASVLSAVAAVGLLLTSCGAGGGGGERREEAPPVTAARQCDGTLSAEAAEALETVLGAKRFVPTAGGRLEPARRKLVAAQAGEGSPLHFASLCAVSTEAVPGRGVDIRAGLYRDFALYDDGKDRTREGRHLYAMGREASADGERADVFAGCASPQMKGSEERPAPLHVWLTFKTPNGGPPPPANTPGTRQAYLTVLHSVALALVRTLGCENDAGLPERPVFAERKWRGQL